MMGLKRFVHQLIYEPFLLFLKGALLTVSFLHLCWFRFLWHHVTWLDEPTSKSIRNSKHSDEGNPSHHAPSLSFLILTFWCVLALFGEGNNVRIFCTTKHFSEHDSNEGSVIGYCERTECEVYLHFPRHHFYMDCVNFNRY
ncbi:hypothetical protein IW262DRAFT_1372200 [Armillaria fumosa]|nr:hypothetical protein IW262DRAFT_1372200 [Armillaria fumosa]